LFLSYQENGIFFASELDGIPNLNNSISIIRIEPQQLFIINNFDMAQIKRIICPEIKKSIMNDNNNLKPIEQKFYEAVIIRLHTTVRPLGCLLSGGVDSSLVSAVASDILKQQNKKLHTFSIGMPGGDDEKYAKIAAVHIGSIHKHIELSTETFLTAIPEVIHAIGSFDITTVRASVGQYLLSKWISENTDIKVLLCGDGSDELCGSYKYFYNAPSEKEYDEECLRLLKDIHYFDGLRADRCISHFGMEARFPFLDINFVKEYLSYEPKLRMPSKDKIEKHLLRSAFKDLNILPDEILWRRKVAFSDGVSSENDSWHKTIQNYIINNVDLNMKECENYNYLPPTTLEGLYYRKIFCEHFGNNEEIAKTIPYYWMPKWCGDINDPSAREITFETDMVDK
jgi:asparagine synthase (glutamine-hydrolysing)